MALQSPDGQADRLTLYNSNGYRMDLTGTPTTNRSIIVPNRAGTLATADQIETRLVEKITLASAVTTSQVIYTTASVPKDTNSVELVINGEVISSLYSPALFTVSSQQITWNPSNGYSIDATDNIIVRYNVANNAAFLPRDVVFQHWVKQPMFKPAFLNSWTDFTTPGTQNSYETSGYRRSPYGDCEIKGTLANSTASSANTASNMFQLPPAMCLSENIIQGSFSYNGTINYSSATFLNGALSTEPFVVKYVPPAGTTISGTVNYHAFRFTYKANVETWLSFGDSVAQGQNASNFATNSYFALYCIANGYRQDNQGVSGTELSNYNSSANNGYDNQTARLHSRVPDGIIVHYGLNDLRRATPVTNFINQYRAILLTAMANGLSPRRIILCSPVVIDSTAYSDAAFSPFNQGTLTLHQSYVTAISNLAKELGCGFCDFFTYMTNNGGSAAFTDTDRIHPKTTAHQSLANYLQSSVVYVY